MEHPLLHFTKNGCLRQTLAHHGNLKVALGSEQALAPVRSPDTFAEGAWDKVPKTKGTFDFVPQVITVASFHKNYIGILVISYCI
jgi:hypothetical protein